MSKKLEAVLRTLNETHGDIVPFDGFNPDSRNKSIEEYFSTMSDEEKITASLHIIEHCSALQLCLHKYLFDLLEDRSQKMAEEIKRQKIELDNQKKPKMTFNPIEVVKISGKSKNTIYTHLKNGKLKGQQDQGGIWIIERKDLENYLHRTDI